MGLTLTVNNFDTFDIGYITFTNFRIELANNYNSKLGELYRRWLFGHIPYFSEKPLVEMEYNEMVTLAGDLMILLAHSDTQGVILPKESRKLYKALEFFQMTYDISEYHCQTPFNLYERLKKMFYYSWKNRRRIIFS